MTLLVSIHETAEAEINEASDFYDIECPGLGSDFIDEIQKTLVHLSSFPDASPLIRSRVRKIPLHRFPYWLIYSVHSNEVRILAVAHQKRRPFYWGGRR